MWFKREISNFIESNKDIVQILIGPRQVGKTSLLRRISKDYTFVSLDDLGHRTMAQENPELFLSQFGSKKVLIDEAQYSPNLFFALKKKADELKNQVSKKENHIRLTGSNQILMDRAVKEGLTGRASYFELSGLSLSEISQHARPPLVQQLFQGGWPELYVDQNIEPPKYLNDYINSYVEKDVALTAGIQKLNVFTKCLGLLAGRTGQVLNFSSLATEVGVKAGTLSDWVSLLERMKILSLVPPFHSNLSKRLTKSPKLFFLDTGIACRLQGWTEPHPIMTSPQLGGLFESLVYSEIYKCIINNQKLWKIFHWRTREGEEIDFILQLENQRYFLIEAKVSQRSEISKKSFEKLTRSLPPQSVVGSCICHMDGSEVYGNKVPVQKLTEYLLDVTR